MVLSGPHPIISCNYHGRLFLHGLGEGEGGSCTNSGMRNNLGKGKGKYKSVDAGNIWGILDLRHYMLTYFGVWCSTAALGSYSTALLHSTPTPLCLCRNSVLHFIMQLRFKVYSFHAALGAKVEQLPNNLIIPLPLWFIFYNRNFKMETQTAS